MKIAVAGGTGVLGRHIVAAAQEAGHDATALSRRTGVDLTTGAGLAASLEGADVVVDAANSPRLSRAQATKFFTTATRHLHEAGMSAGVQRLVTISIVHLDQVTENPYYQAKLAHEEAAKEGPLPATVVRATQFHEFPAQVMQRTRVGPIAFMPHMKVQTVSARALAAEVVDIATDSSPAQLVEVAGPEVHDMVELARAIVAHRGGRVAVLTLPLPGRMGRKFRAGALTAGPDARIVGPPFADWLAGGGLTI